MSHVALGMDLLGWFSEAVIGETEANGSFGVSRAWCSDVPSICVLPRFPGERPRANWPAIRTHWARGSGFPHSSESRLLLGRMPIWLSWLTLGADAVDPRWQHHYADGKCRTMSLRSVLRTHAEALYSAECHLSPRVAQASPALQVVAMPEYFQERAQENLLASLPRDRGEVRLLWQSVAVCLAWIDFLSPQQRVQFEGKRIAVVDVGLAEVSATVLQLRSQSKHGVTLLVPKRDLPESGSSFRWPIIPFDLCVAASLLEEHGKSYGLPELWQVACGGAMAATQKDVPEDAMEAAALVQTVAGWRRLDLSLNHLWAAVAAAALCPTIKGLGELWGGIRTAMSDLDVGEDGTRSPIARTLERDVPEWLGSRREPPDVVLLTGPVSRLKVAADETLGNRLADRLRVPARCKLLVSGRDLPSTVNPAQGCAIYGGRELAELPTYLDTLPRFSIIGKDRLCWKDVYYDLVPHSEWEGGREYRSSAEELQRLRDAAKIPTGRRRVRFRLRRQDQEKQLEQSFDHAPLRDCFLSFDVRMRPAQGFARVRIIPDQLGLFSSGEVLLDWDKMKDEQEPDVPDFPPCAALEPNVRRIRDYAAPAISAYVEAVAANRWAGATERLKRVGQQLQNGNAYGSNPEGPEIEPLLAALDRHHYRHINLGIYKHVRSRTAHVRKAALSQTKDLMRTATGLFAQTPSWARDYLADEFRFSRDKNPDDPNPTPVFLNAAGRCFSAPEQIQLFVECFCLHLHHRMRRCGETGSAPGMNNWCKAFQMILRLHDEAVLHFQPVQAESLANDLSMLLDTVQPKNCWRLPAPYKHALFCLYFLLRFRARPDGADFLANWDCRGTVARRIHDNLSLHRDVGALWQASQLTEHTDETIQGALLRFLESKATAQDIIIMKKAHDASLDLQDDEDGNNGEEKDD